MLNQYRKYRNYGKTIPFRRHFERCLMTPGTASSFNSYIRQKHHSPDTQCRKHLQQRDCKELLNTRTSKKLAET